MRAQLKSQVKSALRLFSTTCRAIGLPPFRARDGFTSRPQFLAEVAAAGEVLEIGPFDRPLLSGPRVRYFDVMDQAALKVRALAHGRAPEGCPAIDYVSERGDLRVITDRRFDAVISAHCIEHQPDLIGHLEQVFELLHPGGRYFAIVPDKRFSFDHYLPETRASELLAAHWERRTVHTPSAILAHRADTTHNTPWRHWIGLHRPGHGADSRVTRLRKAMLELRGAGDDYIDVHGWFFTPPSFQLVMETLIELGAVRFHLERVHGTSFASGEFFAVLRSARVPE